LVAYHGNFRKKKGGKLGIASQCKKCEKIYREEKKEEKREYNKQYYQEHKKESSEYYQKHKEEISEYNKQYREEHKEYYIEYMKEYREENPYIQFNSNNKRRQLEENQGDGITKEQWYEMMCFFDWKCAYSGEYIGGDNNNRTIDHIIPISKGGEHEVWNCVPMYANYNFSKQTSDMEDWYRQQPYFSEERLLKIYAWCEYAYKKWIIEMKERKEQEKEE
jgi:5-methylcytosine-specific restriction endonuclease McrA